jgi:predicted secreted protein
MLIHFLPFIIVIGIFASYWAGIKYSQHMTHVRHTDCQHILLNESHHNTTVTVPTNSGIVLVLEDNPSTGYQWFMVNSAGSVLTLMNDGQHTPLEGTDSIGDKRYGGGGTMLWRFWVNQTGVDTLTLRHRRPWESFDQSYTDYSVTIAVVPEAKVANKTFRLKIC